MNNPDCIFCKIAKGQIPSTKVYEDANFVAFLDIMPANKGHILIIPKKHYITLDHMPPDLTRGLMDVELKMAKAMVNALRPDGYNCLQNNHIAAGQLVPHAHVHIIPRYNGDKVTIDWGHESYEGTEIEELAKKIIDKYNEENKK